MNHLKYWIPTSDTVEFHVLSITAGWRHLVARVFNISSISLDKMKDHYYCNNISPGCKEACFSDFQELLISPKRHPTVEVIGNLSRKILDKLIKMKLYRVRLRFASLESYHDSGLGKDKILSMNKPIEYWRLWVIEIVFVAAPAVFFVLYARSVCKRTDGSRTLN